MARWRRAANTAAASPPRFPQNLSGPYYVFVVTDSGKAVFQNGQTATNTGFEPTAINVNLAPLAQLTPTTITVPATGQPGQAPSSPIT